MTMVKPGKKTSKGRQKIEIRRIEDKEKRQVTLCKRKGGLFKKCSELQLLCGAHVAVAIFSKREDHQPQGSEAPPAATGGRPSRGGSVFAMGTPSVDHVLRRFAPLPGDVHVEDAGCVAAAERAAVEVAAREMRETAALVDAEKKRMEAIGEKVVRAAEAAGKRFWWEADVEALGEGELPEFARALQRVREIVQREAGKRQASAPPAAAAAPWHP
ncbi:hypothetical protein SEVIR_4G131200v4 [Setaria viridis]|uniref:MADS-box domain-containing protein n=3 Tax=Setaria TaxID=4554 RepID=A0A368QWU7_SETIT|nr:agamous-like MADS-box protein AGL62 [Setaria italica]XP_034589379.1 agamous-like MADS-box protein AGL62 [Setaria viridis]RCV21760.1 hypothetical protein SETIT_4G163500v2 [Setaria italica]TKW21618.1 hypothetical protein SEVIR_4G131200v2 [Setaria viridis]